MSCLTLACFAETACTAVDVSVSKSKVLLFPQSEIDYDALDFDAAGEGTLVTNFALKSGATSGLAFTAISAETNGWADEGTFDAEVGLPNFTHTLTTRVYDNKGDGGKAFRAQLAYNKVVAVVDTPSGVQIIGLFRGLQLTESARNSGENNGAAPLTLSTPENKFEGYPVAEFRTAEPLTTQFAELEALTTCP